MNQIPEGIRREIVRALDAEYKAGSLRGPFAGAVIAAMQRSDSGMLECRDFAAVSWSWDTKGGYISIVDFGKKKVVLEESWLA